MTRLMISSFAIIVVVAAAAIMLRSPSASIDILATTSAMPPLHELHAAVGVNKLPVQDIEDQSLVYPTQTKP
jgi:hypothetical protein